MAVPPFSVGQYAFLCDVFLFAKNLPLWYIISTITDMGGDSQIGLFKTGARHLKIFCASENR
jgi:hypothetical protein